MKQTNSNGPEGRSHPAPKHRILSLALALCLLLGMTLYVPGPIAVSAAVDIGTGDVLTGGADLAGTQVYFGSYNNSPILWHIIEIDSNTNTAVLWTTTNMGNRSYDSGGHHQYWENSSICLWLNGTSSGEFLEGFHPMELSVMEDYGTSEEGTYETINIDQRIVLPSVEEIGVRGTTGTWKIAFTDTVDGKRGFNANWWLRSPSGLPDLAALVNHRGYVDPTGGANGFVPNDFGTRPAFRLGLSSVLFTSDASGESKSITASQILEPALAPDGAVKLTVVDDSMSISDISAHTTAGDYITVFYTTNGSYDSLSAIVQKADGRISYYGRLADDPSGSGDATVWLPDDLDPTDQLLVFVEKINGANKTDYASEPVAVMPALKITTQPSNESVTEGAPAAFSVTASGYDLTYQWQESTDGGGSFTNISDAKSDSYSIPAADITADGRQYRVVVSDVYRRQVISNAATLTVREASTTKEIIEFTIPGQQGNTVIDDTEETIELTMPFETDVSNLTPDITHTGASISPDSGVAQDFTNPVPYTVTAQDSTSKTYTVTVRVEDAPPTGTEPTITTSSLPNGEVGEAYSEALDANGDAPISWTIAGGNLPLGLSLSGSGVISGTPTQKETANFTVKAENAHGEDTKALSIKIASDEGGGTNPGDGDGDGGETPGTPEPSGGSRSRSSSNGSRSTLDRQVAKAALSASAFNWDGRTLTIDQDGVTTMGLLSVQWDGKPLNRDTDYGVYQGSVIIRFSEDFMAAQAHGNHTVRVEFLNYTGEVTVMGGGSGVAAGTDNQLGNDTDNPNTGGYPDGHSPTGNPNTGDGQSIWPALLLGSLGGILLVVGRLKPVA